MIGKTISHYKIINKLGSGGMGVVYKAQDLRLDRTVALKFLSPHLTTSEDEKQRFIHEAKAASSLDHNNICAIYEIDETEDGQLFISMACYEGETLDNRIKEKPLPIDEATDIAIQIAQGLAKAHEKDIVHRDIKPANIMLTSDGVVKILDFGLAKLSTQTKLTKESTTLGTVSYMSPEQAKGEEVDYRTDIWSLGVILYEMLTGQLPFRGEYESAVIYSILNDTQEPVTGLRTGVPMELERIINKCLQKNPANRYQHVDELIVDLRSMKREPESSIIPTKMEHPSKRSKPIKMSVAVLSILILIVVGYVILIQPSEKSVSGWENSIAVLPFDDLSPEGDQEWFCDGMTEQIITNLSKIKRLKVIGRTSIMKFKNTNKTLPEIGQELNVSHILEGSIRKHENNIRVTAQLINTEDGSHIWADDFDRELEHVFEVQDDVSEAIAKNLLMNISQEEKSDITTNRPKNKEAYEYYIRGNYYWWKFFTEKLSQDDFDRSETMFKKAIELDSTFAPIYANLAALYATYVYQRLENQIERRKFLDVAEKYYKLAYRLNPNLSEVQRVKGWIHYANNELEEAYRSFQEAVNIKPNDHECNRSLGVYFRQIGFPDKSLKYFNKAIELDPLFVVGYISRAQAWEDVKMFNEASKDYRNALEIEQNSLLALRKYACLLIGLNNFKVAEEYILRCEKIDHEVFQLLMKIYDGVMMNKKLEINIDNFLNVLFELHDRPCSYLKLIHHPLINHPALESIRNTPRFQEILAKHKEIYEENLKKYGDLD